MEKKKKGFTLIELIIVIAIISILAAIALPKYNQSRKKAAETANEANIQVLRTAAQMALTEGDEDSFPWQGSSDYIDKWPEVPKGIDEDGKMYRVNLKDGQIEVEFVDKPADN